MNNELIKVSNWIASNKLTLNVGKTFYMVSSHANLNIDNIDIKINNTSLSRVKHKIFGSNSRREANLEGTSKSNMYETFSNYWDNI